MSGTLNKKIELSFLVKISLIIIQFIQTTTTYYFNLFYPSFFIINILNPHLKYGTVLILPLESASRKKIKSLFKIYRRTMEIPVPQGSRKFYSAIYVQLS